MIDMEIALPHSELSAALSVLFACGDGMRPIFISNEEDGPRLPVSDFDQVNELIGSGSGVFLWSPECFYDVSVSDSGAANIFASSDNFGEIDAIFSSMVELPIMFGYACEHEERVHRNRIERRMDYGVHEAWVGRDFSRYLPGVYWLTAIPVEMQRRLDISIDNLRALAVDVSLVGNRNWLLRLYSRPDQWRGEALKLDKWCSGSPGCFSKAVAEKALNQASNFIEASACIKEWR